MTVLVGVRCTDGVVIGADSAQTSSAGTQQVMMVTGGVKLETHFGRIITATTGAVGLSQRFHAILDDVCQGKELEKKLAWPPMDFSTSLSEATIKNFDKTKSPAQLHPQIGWGFGALVGFASDKHGPHLVEFDHIQFHPELKGLTDGAGQLKSKPFATMGSGQPLADPFIAHAHRVLFGADNTPSVQQGRLLVTWTLLHVLQYATGNVGGELNIAEITKSNGAWATSKVDAGEARQQCQEIEMYIGGFGKPQRPPEPVVDLGNLPQPPGAAG